VLQEANLVKGVVEAAIAVAIVIGSSLIVLSTITPFVEEGKSTQAFEEAKNTLSQVDQAMQQLLVESTGARRQIDLNIREGRLIVAGDEDRIKIRLEGFTVLQPGATVQEGNIQIQGGGVAEATEEDVDGNGTTDYVLRNKAVTFAIAKIGNSTNWAAINTSTMITQIYNNRTGTGIVPGSGISINDWGNTSAGTGYTALTNRGRNVESGSILVFVNSTANITYEALFTLAAGTDFVTLEVKKITGA